MVRIRAIFTVVCMALFAGSFGLAAYLRFGMTGAESALVALGLLTALALYTTIAGRMHDRSELRTEIASLSHGAADLARQLAEFGRRLDAMESNVESVLERALTTAQPLAAELDKLSSWVDELAHALAAHEARHAGEHGADRATVTAGAATTAAAAAAAPSVAPLVPAERPSAAFGGLDRDGVIAAVRSAIEAGRVELYLQPVVTLPQRKVRYYEAMARLNLTNGDLVAAGDFLTYAEAGSLLPKLDDLAAVRSVQIVRRLLLKSSDIGLFCNLSRVTLSDAGFSHFLAFVDANRAIASALVFEFTQSAVRAMGPPEHERLAALADRGFRFSMDNLADLRVDPGELNARGFRFIKMAASLLLNRAGAASSDIPPADLSDRLGRFGIDLIADRIESESTVVNLLDHDVRFGQGFLFSPPRPLRVEVLQGGDAGKPAPPAKAHEADALRSSNPAALITAGKETG
jgi:cyclic-di-GMP phosphodiesterase, flagellum assembly factor TipF